MEGLTSFSEIYEQWIETNHYNSEKTAISYDSTVKRFFNETLNKDVYDVNAEDILRIKKIDVDKFVNNMKDSRKVSTVKQNLSGVKSLWNELKVHDYNVNSEIFATKLKDVEERYNHLNRHELQGLYDYIENEKGSKTVRQKTMAVKLMSTLGIRRDSAFKLTWNDFSTAVSMATGIEYKVLKFISKGKKKHVFRITNEFYQELLELKTDNVKVINISEKTMERLLEGYGQIIGKNICLHSLRHTAITSAYYSGGKDLVATKDFAGHDNIETTSRYIHEPDEPTSQLSYIVTMKVDESLLSNASHEDLLNAINGNEELKRLMLIELNKNKK